MQVFKNIYRLYFMAFIAEYIFFRTSVRRNRRCHKELMPGSKKLYLTSILKYTVCLLLVAFFFCTAQLANAQQKLNNITLQFVNKAGEKLLNADSIYTNPFGETFTVRTFKYYISHIVLQDDATGKRQSYNNDYFLVDDADTSSKKIVLQTDLNSITSIHFLLGVDSLKNVSGVQEGTLDPVKGMFWTWNSGYVMAKIEGNSPVAKTPQHAFSYDIGGYKKNENTERQIDLKLPRELNTENAQINIEVNIMTWFNAVNEMKIANTPFCHEPGVLAKKIADNYAKMFSIQK